MFCKLQCSVVISSSKKVINQHSVESFFAPKFCQGRYLHVNLLQMIHTPLANLCCFDLILDVLFRLDNDTTKSVNSNVAVVTSRKQIEKREETERKRDVNLDRSDHSPENHASVCSRISSLTTENDEKSDTMIQMFDTNQD